MGKRSRTWKLFAAPYCYEKYVRLVLVSPDIDADSIVNLIDFSMFAGGYISPPRPYDPRFDIYGDGQIGLVDLALFAQHFRHGCS
ncbi:MAG: hypothetical protein GTO42_01175 [Candidatus Latescibacteria bacterium]|nr:hypothetical protein [Candidatus Latescibacterota bacterium]NIO27141.1 hypothetical protein [Candidatus Latescibacterota bacterium]NIO54665.1 hypothetical protein [Candidatus Latescibacterota bacterium]NIT00748.1 hypothetical protein [Candidatus Latescibacterota bacterium]NIT37671.1 hypothetical protein [Candidatus Latescibacterota bacterium]